MWVIDGNNVMGAGADGWWRDPTAAAVRIAEAVAMWGLQHDDPMILVFDGRPQSDLLALATEDLAVDFATRSGRDAADDRIVEIVEQRFAAEAEITVVTSDRGLADRLPPGVMIEGAGRFRERIGLKRPAGKRGRH